jgi:drug/metabolite transporter (DMT)-like permease
MAAAAQLFCGGLANTALALARGERLPVAAPPSAILAFIYLVLFGSVVAFTAYNYLLANTRTTIATSYAYVNPLLALGLGALLGHEHVSVNALVSTVFVIVGVAVVVTAPQRES